MKKIPLIAHKRIHSINPPFPKSIPNFPKFQSLTNASHGLNGNANNSIGNKIPIKPFLNLNSLKIIHYGFEHFHQLDKNVQILVRM